MVSQNKLMEDMNDFVTLKIWHCSDIDRSTKSPSFCKIMENCSPTKCRILCFFYCSYFTVSGSGLSGDPTVWIFVSFCCLNSFLWTMLGGAIPCRDSYDLELLELHSSLDRKGEDSPSYDIRSGRSRQVPCLRTRKWSPGVGVRRNPATRAKACTGSSPKLPSGW